MKKVITKWNIESILKNTIADFSTAFVYEREASIVLDLFDRVIDLTITLDTEGEQIFFIAGQQVAENVFWHKFDQELTRLQAFSARCGEFLLDGQMVAEFMAATTPLTREKIVAAWNIPSNLPSFDMTVAGLLAWYNKYTR